VSGLSIDEAGKAEGYHERPASPVMILADEAKSIADDVFTSFARCTATWRARDGSIITFDVPGAGTGAFQGTLPQSIGPAGAIAGYYIDASNVSHGFVRASDGAITTLDAPGAGTGSGQGTVLYTSNPRGAIAGFYVDSSYVSHWFLVEGE
jgi:hypothetical protein